MQMLPRIVKWVLEAWPFLVIVALDCIRRLLYAALPLEQTDLNRFAAGTLQIVGALIVLYTLNQNLGSFRKQSLLSMIVLWVKEFPLIGKSAKIYAESLNFGVTVAGNSTLSIKKKFNTVEERLTELERRIDECRQLVFDKEKEFNLAIGTLRQELKKEIFGSNERIREVKALLDGAVVGGLKTQLLGVLLVIYGGLIGIS